MMKTSRTLIRSSCLLALASALIATGCSKKSETTSTTPTAPATPAAAPTASSPSADSAKAASDQAAEAKQKLESATAKAAEELKARSETAVAPDAAAASATAAAGSSMDALKAQAEQLMSQYSGELATLKEHAATLKGLIDKNAAMLPAGVADKYQELNALLPQLSSMVDSLRNYQSADLTTLVPKLKADFAQAQKLYTEIKGMLPAV